MPRSLYHLVSCPFCEKVRLALALERSVYESVEIDPDDRTAVRQISGQENVPVLVEEDGTVLQDANRILRHLAGQPDSSLLPDGRRDQALTWLLVEHADRRLAPLTYRLIRRRDPDGNPVRDDDLRILERKLEEELRVFEGLLERGPFLFGDRPTVADVAAHAFLNRLVGTGERSLPEDCLRLSAWYRRVEEAAGRTPSPLP